MIKFPSIDSDLESSFKVLLRVKDIHLFSQKSLNDIFIEE